MEILFELIFEIFGEIVFSIIAEIIGHLFLWIGFRNEPEMEIKKKSRSLTRGTLVGIILGVLSLAVISHPIIKSPTIQGLNLFLTPLFLGFWTMSLGTVDEKSGRSPSSQDTFFYGAIFGFTFALTRLVYFLLF